MVLMLKIKFAITPLRFTQELSIAEGRIVVVFMSAASKLWSKYLNLG